VVFRRIFPLLVLLVLAGACTLENNPPQTAAASQAGAPTLPRAIEKEVGPAYSSPALQSLVDRVGQKLVTSSGLSGSYRFYVLDQPIANAHAMSSGYVFVTRGLLALMDDEAELAAAMGHELGHIVQKHAAQREQARKGVLDSAVDAALKSGSMTVGRSVAREGLLQLRRYSRDQELEADQIGLAYITRSGYRGDAMIKLIDKLRRQSRLEDELMGEAAGAAEGGDRGALSTHPAPDDRLAALRAMGRPPAPGASNRAGYLKAIEGMSVDDAPEEGFVRGSRFVHPILQIAFELPRDFKLFNDHDGVIGIGQDRSMMYFSCRSEAVPGRLDDWMRDQLKPTPTDIEETAIGGAEAAIGARPRGSDTGLGQIRYVIIRHDEGICYFNLLADGPDRDRRIEILVAAARSFHRLSAAEAATLRPYRLRVMARDRATAADLAGRLPYPDLKMQRLLTLNGVDSAAEFARLSEVKMIVP
jgi:predicted Zn-dependent protease